VKKWLIVLMCLGIAGCAGLSANLNTGTRILGVEQQVMVFPFRNPSYKGQELMGMGDAVTNAVWAELQKRGISATIAPKESFPATKMIDPQVACRYGREKGADIVLIGVTTEWVDGATNWSGKLDVVGATVTAYTTSNNRIVATASARQNGGWFTWVNNPADRFLPTLSRELVSALFR